jgi:hypothetical protein
MLLIFTPRRACPSTSALTSNDASRHFWHALHQPCYTTCSVTSTGGGGGTSITCRRRVMLHHPCRFFPTTGTTGLGISFLPGLFLPLLQRDDVCLDEGRGRRLLFLEFLDALVGHCQLFLQEPILLQGLTQPLFKLLDPFFWYHAQSLSDTG